MNRPLRAGSLPATFHVPMPHGGRPLPAGLVTDIAEPAINPQPPERLCPVVEAVRADLLARSQKGVSKYGHTLADNPLTTREWLQHAFEECLDQANYLKTLIMRIDARSEDPAEAAFWEMDARIKGNGEWKGRPQSERDAFKAVARKLLAI